MSTTIKQQAKDHYRSDVEALTDQQLARLLLGEGLEPGTHRSIKAALEELANEILIDRGHLMPHLFALSCEL